MEQENSTVFLANTVIQLHQVFDVLFADDLSPLKS